MLKRVTTVIVGAGQCGLAMSRELARRDIDHVVLERGRIGNSWIDERWDSLRMLTPNWLNTLQGPPEGDPDGYMTAPEFVRVLRGYAKGAPVEERTGVISVDAQGGGYLVQTDRGAIFADAVVMANGASSTPKVPAFAAELPGAVVQTSPVRYKRPSDLPEGEVLVVGASASGLQLARELRLSGRPVTLAVGNHLRLPRDYRGADIMTWMHLVGALDVPFTKVDDIERVRRTPSLPLLGDASHTNLDLKTLQDMGVRIVGRLQAAANGRVWFSGGLANMCAAADLKMNRLLDRIDAWATAKGFDELTEPAERFAPTRVPSAPELSLPFDRIASVVWATGYRPDHSWLKLPVFDRKGALVHRGGVVAPGLYALGLRYLRTARSAHISGASRDAKALARHLTGGLERRLAA